jgi:hypothetical protein
VAVASLSLVAMACDTRSGNLLKVLSTCHRHLYLINRRWCPFSFLFLLLDVIVVKVELATPSPYFTPTHVVPREDAHKVLLNSFPPLPRRARRSTPVFFETCLQLNH